jgi:hypothetical protein
MIIIIKKMEIKKQIKPPKKKLIKKKLTALMILNIITENKNFLYIRKIIQILQIFGVSKII